MYVYGNPSLRTALLLLGLALAALPLGTGCGQARVAGSANAEQTTPGTDAKVSPTGKVLLPLVLTGSAGPLRVDPANPRYFANGSGKIVYLTGSHTWANLQDAGPANPPPAFDYAAYLDFLTANHHNFFRLWAWEQSRGVPEDADGATWFSPSAYRRTGPGNALDGGPRFDLTQFDQAYFDRMRERIVAAGSRGVYVSVMLFNGWSVGQKPSNPGNPWPGHPFHRENNVNGVDGDPNQDGNGYEVQTLAVPAITALQEAYIRKVVDTVNDLDNVLYEICNESNQGLGETEWQYHMIRYVKSYEASKPKQHPVGMTVAYPDGINADLLDGPADWISPNAEGGFKDEPPAADGGKVSIVDSDHLWGEGGDREWVWKTFTRGHNVIYMDCYQALYCGKYPPDDPTRLSVVKNLGYTLAYAERVNLAAMTPRPDLCSTGYCLANPVARGAEYLAYLPAGGSLTVDLSATKEGLAVEWFNPADGSTVAGEAAVGGGARSFRAPFGGDAVLYLRAAAAAPAGTCTSSPPASE